MTIYNFEFTGAVQTRTLPSGTYKLECWGAQGGVPNDTYSNYGCGAYSKGIITLPDETDVYIYVGEQGKQTGTTFNVGYTKSLSNACRHGGGASDIRIGVDSLYSRVIVAGGGGGSAHYSASSYGTGGHGGGLYGGDGTSRTTASDAYGRGGTQIAGGLNGHATDAHGSFGCGGIISNYTNDSGGGGGWYGGGGGRRASSDGCEAGGGGGSGWTYTSGTYTTWLAGNPADAEQYLLTSDYYLESTGMNIPNYNQGMFDPDGRTVVPGHKGNGYVRIQSLIKIVYNNNPYVVYSYLSGFAVAASYGGNTWCIDTEGVAETVQDIIDIFNDPTKVLMKQDYVVDDVYADPDFTVKLSPDTILTDIPKTTVYVKPVIHLYNKVIYGDETLIDLTTDTVTANKILNGYTAHDASGAKITGNCQYDANTKDATATASEIITGKSAYVHGSKIDGTMTNVGTQTSSITTANQSVSIQTGYHDGSGSVSIDATEIAKLIPENIKKDVDILGVLGTLAGGGGSTVVKSGTFNTGTGKVRPYNHFTQGQGTVDQVGFTIQHNLGSIPKFIILIADLNGWINVGDTTICGFAWKTSSGWNQKGFQSSDSYSPDHVQIFNSTLDAEMSKNDMTANSWGCFVNVTNTEMFIVPGGQDTPAAFQDNFGYTWVAIGGTDEPASAGYTPVNYVQTDGNCYFDLGIKPTRTDGFVCTMQLLNTSTNQAVFGTRVEESMTDSQANTYYLLSSGKVRRDYYTKYTVSTASYNANNLCTIYVFRNYSTLQQGTQQITATTATMSTGTSDYNLYLCACNSSDRMTNPATCKLYHFQITETTGVIYNYVPVLDPDGVPCLYESVHGTVIYKSGDGTLTYG